MSAKLPHQTPDEILRALDGLPPDAVEVVPARRHYRIYIGGALATSLSKGSRVAAHTIRNTVASIRRVAKEQGLL